MDLSNVQLGNGRTGLQQVALNDLEQVAWEFEERDRSDDVPVVVDVDVSGYTTLSTRRLRALEHCSLADVHEVCERLPDAVGREIFDEVTDR
jgi:hypothetical protein